MAARCGHFDGTARQQLAAYIGEQGHGKNERSGGKEGGRIVRKLVSEWMEAALQRETSARPEEYKRCEAVVLEFTPPSTPPEAAPVAPVVSIVFR